MEEGIGYYFKVINDKIKVGADAELKEHDLTLTQSRVLWFLNSKGGEAGQKEIEEHLQVSHPTVVGLVSRMEQKGFIEITQNPEDRRTNIVRLMPKATASGQEMEKIVNAQDEKMLKSLTREQIKELKEMLIIISKNLD